jgi:multiple sugar transport system substrate-binding protein
MASRLSRPGVLLAVFALVVGACGGSNTAPSAAPSTSASAAASEVAASVAAPSAVAPSVIPTVPPGGPVSVTWFCCLGGGDEESQQKTFKDVAKAFEATHPNIKIVLDHTAYAGARQAFSVKLASGTPPDVVGPIGVGGASAFEGQWLDLQPLITKNQVDLSGYDQQMLDLYKAGGQGQYGIPFAIYPSELYYQPDMFDEAELEYPPANYGDQYKMPDGTMVEWNYDTVRNIAMLLTLDKSGKNATEAGFDPGHIVQYGFEPQRDDLRTIGAGFFGQGRLLADDGKTAQIPDAWRAAWHWIYDGIWKDHFIMSDQVYQTPAFMGGYDAFNSGKIAMDENFLWSVCCITEAGGNWNLAALPAYQGKVTAPINADTFRITKNSKHPDEAFEFLRYLVAGEGRTKLLNAISGFPALKSDQPSFFDQLKQQKNDKGKLIYPPDVNWDVAPAGIQYADVQTNTESFMPNYNKSLDVLVKYLTRFTGTPGLDVDAELTKMQTELQAAFNK